MQEYYAKIIPNKDSDGFKSIADAYAENKKVSNAIQQIKDQDRCHDMSLLVRENYHITLNNLEVDNKVCDSVKPGDIQAHLNGSKLQKYVQDCLDHIKKLACEVFKEVQDTEFTVVNKEEIVDDQDRVGTMGKFLAVKLNSASDSEHIQHNPHISVVRGASYGKSEKAKECLNELLEDYIGKANDRNIKGSIFVDAVQVNFTDTSSIKYNDEKCSGVSSEWGEL